MILDGIYGEVVSARNALYDRRIFKPRHLNWPVVSVGNISAGGSGKTPFVIALGELLLKKGIGIDVLSRGYRRSTSGVMKVDPSGTPEQFGDEPLLIARKLRCPVIVGESRYSAGVYAEDEGAGASQNRMHLLDDAFQHRQLHRDFDIVLLNTEDLDDKLLPSGRLRESVASLLRADAVIVDCEFPIGRLPKGKFQLWHIERKMEIPEFQSPVIAFCGIARPQRFFDALRSAVVDLRKEIAFRDHHRYTAADVQRLTAIRTGLPGSMLVTTEKDAVNLGAHLDKLRPVVIPMKIELQDSENAIKHLLGILAERAVCPHL
ncbi:MAG TPA: tetraacyldisaccharide 4'-kinase [Terriglobales bacterium]|jgi:tetraacyldisaccharide 4'-kinase|nr:tetraacyldisaccharide 4'-kinase [Terriglobales bacterium]